MPDYCPTHNRYSIILNSIPPLPQKADSQDRGEVWLGVGGRGVEQPWTWALGKQGAFGCLCLEVAKTLAEREVKKHLMANFNLNYYFISPQSGLAFLSSWLIYSLFLNWALINSFPLNRWKTWRVYSWSNWASRRSNAECVFDDTFAEIANSVVRHRVE